MIYAIISDIHSNLESLTEFIKILNINKIEKIIILGDIVGYNTNPNECIKIISSIKNSQIIRGNHDRAVKTKVYWDFSSHASAAIYWTINHCNYFSENFLKSIQKGPLIVDNNFGICHGSAIDEDKYMQFTFQTKEDFDWLKKKNINLLFSGHTHIPVIFSQDNTGKIFKLEAKELNILDDKYYIINPGSIGQPRNKTNKASFIIYDSNQKKFSFINYSYNFKLTQKKILNENLPSFLAQRLYYGR